MTDIEEKQIAQQLYNNMHSQITPSEFDTQHNEDAKDCAIVACDWVLEGMESVLAGREENSTQYLSWKRIRGIINKL